MRLANKVAIVTGAGSGFGEGIAKRFAQEGCKVVVNDINAENGERVAREINAAGGEASFIQADVARDADVARMMKFAIEKFKRLHIVVNNAGATHRNRPMLGVTEEEFDRIYAVNVKSLYLTAKTWFHISASRAAAASSPSPRPAACGRGRASPGTTAARARRSPPAAR